MSLINTRLLELRAKGNLDKFENRPSKYGALDTFIRQTTEPGSIITQELQEKAFASFDNDLKVPVINYDSGISIASTRPAVISDSENTSQLVTISFSTYSWGFTIVPAAYRNNEIKMQQDFEAKFMKYLNAFAAALDSAAVTALNTNRTQVFNKTLIYSEVGNTIKAKWAQREKILGDLEVLLASNDYQGQTSIVGNMGLFSIIKQLSEHGLMNDQNKQLQYLDKVLGFTNRITDPAGRYATGYAIPEASVGMLYRFEPEAVNKTISKTGHEWDIATLPMLNIPVGTYFYPGVGDYHAIGGASTAGLTRAYKEHYGFAVDIALVTAYTSSPSTRPSPFIKFTINDEATDSDTTAPTVTVSGTGLTSLVLTFNEAICLDDAGTLASGDIKALFEFNGADTATITSATVNSTAKVITFVIVAGDLAATDTIRTKSGQPLYDANGNSIAAQTALAKVNAGGTAWEAAA